MHASTITSTLLFSLFSLGALASPTPANEAVNHLHKRANRCESSNIEGLYKRWNIWVDNDANYNGACGSGCLDNIRGRCGSSVTDWGCDRDGNGQGYYHFNTPTTCSEYDMTQALKACLKGQTIDCHVV
ncbi:hypothetical protein MPH_01325 [Macrophomina phaseolina MS6]|uniref:Uncharacterized protein n=1 Tax=Macrophomina phaseolina (strain MS6) TaxID=1126212 RepID=K2S2Y2_MACPH|nr:hypothetical protein MPH_01325 [Macrophomina phaseolina MS6]